jgi:transcriptional regulator with XRE-family HTH domain
VTPRVKSCVASLRSPFAALLRHVTERELLRLPLHERIAAVRGALTQEAFAAELGTDRERVNSWERARSAPGTMYAEKLAAYAGVSSADVFRHPREIQIEQLEAALASVRAVIGALKAESQPPRRRAQERG